MPREVDWEALVAAATAARARAYEPYSHFAVGAAVLTEDGAIHPGCNVENRTYGLTVCAERVAVTGAVARGAGRPVAVVVVAECTPPAPPCGQCREVLWELGGPELPVLCVNPAGERLEVTMADLLPHPFELPPAGSR